MTKTCKDCGKDKPIDEFYKNKRMADGRLNSCNSCHCEKSHVYRETHPSAKIVPEYGVWKGIRQRCQNPRNDDYPRYGGRGIRVCKDWDSYQRFYGDMGTRPTPLHQIDRIDNDGNYEPDNCRWVLPVDNVRNSSHVILSMDIARKIRALHARGLTIKDVARQLSLNIGTTAHVIYNRTWKEVVSA